MCVQTDRRNSRPVLSAVVDTGAPGSPLPADHRSREAVGATRQRLAAAAGERTGRSSNFFLINLWGHWEGGQQVRPFSERLEKTHSPAFLGIWLKLGET